MDYSDPLERATKPRDRGETWTDEQFRAARDSDLTERTVDIGKSVIAALSCLVLAALLTSGKIVEIAECDELFDNPLHPYTKALLEAVPVPDPDVENRREHTIMSGEVPSPMNPPSGCVFHPRCSVAVDGCSVAKPELRELRPGHFVACTEV